MVEQIKQPVPVVEQVKQPVPASDPVLPIATRIELQLDRTVTIPCSYIRLIRLDGRQSVLQICSNKDAGETFPSFFLRAEPPQSEPAALAGAQLPAEVYVQQEADGPVLYTTEALPAQISITSAAPDRFIAEFTGQLETGGSGKTQQVTGKLSGLLQVSP